MAARSFLANTCAVFVKEIRTLTRSPLLYVLGAVFLGLAGYFFYTDVLYFDLLNQDKIGLTQGLWQRFFEDLRLCLLLVSPVLAARLFAEERRLGTMEMLLTYPLTEVELVGGKFLSLVFVFVPLLATTVLYPVVLSTLWSVDPWPLVATYAGALLLGIVCLSCGMFCSALATQQSSAALAAFGILFLFWFLAWNEAAASPLLLAVLRRLSLFDRFYDFSRGTVQSRDVVYFLVAATLFVVFSLQALRWRWQPRGRQLLRVLLVVSVGIGVEDWAVRHNRAWEFVQERESLLAQETLAVLAAVPVPVRLTLFYEPGRYRETAYLAEKCRRASFLIHVQLIDLDRDPALARAYGVRAYGTIVVEAEGRRELVYPPEEQLLAQAIMKVTDPRQRLVCVTTGHGENEVTTEQRVQDEDPPSLGLLLEQIGYRWQEIVVAQEEAALQLCRFLFVYGPRYDFSDAEVTVVEHFLAAGGNGLFLIEPRTLPRLEDLFRHYHVIPGGEIESEGAARLYLRDRWTVPVVEAAFSARGQERFTAVFHQARQVNYVATSDGTRGGIFLGYRSPTQGLIPVGTAVETSGEGGGRLMVVGDADFLSGSLFLRESNRAIFVEMLRWLEERHTVPSLPRERYAYAPLNVGQTRWLFWTALFPPLAFLACGGVAWWLRKRG